MGVSPWQAIVHLESQRQATLAALVAMSRALAASSGTSWLSRSDKRYLTSGAEWCRMVHTFTPPKDRS